MDVAEKNTLIAEKNSRKISAKISQKWLKNSRRMSSKIWIFIMQTILGLKSKTAIGYYRLGKNIDFSSF